MIDEAVKLGVWGIKLQKRDLTQLEYGAKYIPRDDDNSFGKNYYEHRAALEFDTKQIEELKNYAEKQKLEVVVTAFDINSIREMFKIGIKYIKIPSQLLSNYEINRELVKTKEKSPFFNIICSTGMHTISEVIEWQYIKDFDVVMYCKSIYPAKANQMNMANFRYLQENLKNAVGYSSHDENGFAIPCAVILGARYIERHYTLNKAMKGSDHSTVSSDYFEMQRIIEEIKYAEKIMGNVELTELRAEEEKQIKRRYRKI